MKKLYLTTWDYNKYLIMEELKKIILVNGGFMVSTWEKKQEKTKIYNRSISEKIETKQKYVEFLEGKKESEELKEYKNNIEKTITKYLEEIITLEKQYKKATRIVTNNGYLQFVLNGYLYYIQFDDNPFFDFYYQKQTINDNLTITDKTYLEILPKYDLFTKDFYNKYTKKNLQDTARNIYNYLLKAKKGEKYEKYHLPQKYYKMEG